jgi:hypothetical protein
MNAKVFIAVNENIKKLQIDRKSNFIYSIKKEGDVGWLKMKAITKESFGLLFFKS